MRVKATCNLGTNDYHPDHALQEGDEAEVPHEVGVQMVARSHAVEVAPAVEAAKEVVPIAFARTDKHTKTK